MDSPEERLVELANYRMPFGKHRGQRLVDLPEPYLVWFKNRGLPAGKLGRYMQQALDLKLYGLERLLDPLRVPPVGQPRQGPHT